MNRKADPGIYVSGDAAVQEDKLKYTFAANSQARVCANAVRGAQTGSRVFRATFTNTYWSQIDTNDGVKVGATCEATDAEDTKSRGFISSPGDISDLRKATYE